MNDTAAGTSEVNPYAAPQADLQLGVEPVEAHAVQFYAMSPLKVGIMGSLAFGIYDFVFWWRHWSVRRAAGQDVSVFWRTFFSPLFAFEFRSSVQLALVSRGLSVHPLLTAAPLVYLLASAVDRILGRVGGVDLSLALLSLVMNIVRGTSLAFIQKGVNSVLEADGYRGSFNRGISFGAVALGALGTLLWAAHIAESLFPGWFAG